MDLAQESFIIDEQQAFSYRLECDAITGYIRVTNYKKTKRKKTRITRRNIPIDTLTKDKFYYNRTGWFDVKNGDPFTGSYVSKQDEPNKFKYWEKYIRDMYSAYKIKQENIDNQKN